MITLGIDYGAANIGIALVRNSETGNEPLFAATMRISARALKDKVQNRAAARRLRRTRKTKKARLRELETRLLRLGVDETAIAAIVRFSARRGYKPLSRQEELEEQEREEELTYRYSREEFFQALEVELSRWINDDQLRSSVFKVCERVLNRHGEPHLEVRTMRIDNRGVSRCAWEGCTRVTPRRVNATTDAIVQQLATFFISGLKDEPSALEEVEKAAAELNRIGLDLRAGKKEERKEKARPLRKRAREILRGLRARFETTDSDDKISAKSWNHFQTGVMGILERVGGRNRYCREHSREYVRTIIQKKKPPFKKTIRESDILSRREQITFSKIWRYVEARLLPLAPMGIDRIVVERTAFDLLQGNSKKVRATKPERVEEIYQLGPMLGFSNRLEMLRTEFNGLCAYCGNPASSLLETEHIMPRSDFFFDGYLNVLPSCPTCNREKKTRRFGAAGLHISEKAYEEYNRYLGRIGKTRPLHALHNEKRGLLNLMKDPQRSWDVDRYLSLIANSLASIVQTQRGPRPLARFLYLKLSARQKKAPDIDFRNGRHNAVYRMTAYPKFEKAEEKAAGGTVNHALDAMLLGCELPSMSMLEGRGLNPRELGTWKRGILTNAPTPGKDGIPAVPRHDWCVDGFENVDANGYVEIDLATMNWNQRDSATHKQDPYGWSEKERKPTKRKSAQELYDKLVKLKDAGKLKGLVETIYHPALRKAMAEKLDTSSGREVAKAMKEWIRTSIARSIDKSTFSSHPADVRRKNDLKEFVRNPEAPIPAVIGIKCLDRGVKGKIDFERRDRQSGRIGQRYMTAPANRAVILAYVAGKDGKPNISRPSEARVRQNLAIKTSGKAFLPKPDLLERGVLVGDRLPSSEEWERLLENYLRDCGFHSYATLTPCCVIRYDDGSECFVRNFEKESFKSEVKKNIVGVRRNPFDPRITPFTVLTGS